MSKGKEILIKIIKEKKEIIKLIKDNNLNELKKFKFVKPL
jgi:hypothetical protein